MFNELRNDVIRKENHKNENIDKTIDLVEKALKFNKQKNVIPNSQVFNRPKQTRVLNRIPIEEMPPFKSNESFVNEIRNDEKNMNGERFRGYFRYQNLTFLAKELLTVNQVKSNQILNQAIYSINELRNAVIRKEIPENESVNKIISVVEEIIKLITNKKVKNSKS